MTMERLLREDLSTIRDLQIWDLYTILDTELRQTDVVQMGRPLWSTVLKKRRRTSDEEGEDSGPRSGWLTSADPEGSGDWGNTESWAWGRVSSLWSDWNHSTTTTTLNLRAAGLTSARDDLRVMRRDFDGLPTREWSRLQLERFFGTEGSEPPTLTVSQVQDRQLEVRTELVFAQREVKDARREPWRENLSHWRVREAELEQTARELNSLMVIMGRDPSPLTNVP
ncbi:hypothetical protein BT96DRAFT_993377 [Gymnopus androsaceus JB14]|uniref:Uncharacterized protein n=1 Tax=Gymnopus androsaceus JB14 TaxID=1447944 RepID=A0A6A4HNL7_9AGAR|nr:hypothetical protein BT96DRAFT_993377 [Gymnopus androsaceus JB14]